MRSQILGKAACAVFVILGVTPVSHAAISFFNAPSAILLNPGPDSVVKADFNRDGFPDLAVTSGGIGFAQYQTVTILLNRGDGTFKRSGSYEINDSPSSVVVADFNGDGKLDLALFCGSVAVLLGNGDGTFQMPLYDTHLTGGPLTVGDFNNDGKPDLVYPNCFSNNIGVARKRRWNV